MASYFDCSDLPETDEVIALCFNTNQWHHIYQHGLYKGGQGLNHRVWLFRKVYILGKQNLMIKAGLAD